MVMSWNEEAVDGQRALTADARSKSPVEHRPGYSKAGYSVQGVFTGALNVGIVFPYRATAASRGESSPAPRRVRPRTRATILLLLLCYTTLHYTTLHYTTILAARRSSPAEPEPSAASLLLLLLLLIIITVMI